MRIEERYRSRAQSIHTSIDVKNGRRDIVRFGGTRDIIHRRSYVAVVRAAVVDEAASGAAP